MSLAEDRAREKRNEYNRKYYQAHKEKCRAKARAWREANPEKYKAIQIAYAERMGEKLSKKREESRRKRLVQAVEGGKNAPDIEKAKALFRSPIAAAHLQWRLDKRKSEIQDNAPELAPADGASE